MLLEGHDAERRHSTMTTGPDSIHTPWRNIQGRFESIVLYDGECPFFFVQFSP
jgi:hypothetical protein